MSSSENFNRKKFFETLNGLIDVYDNANSGKEFYEVISVDNPLFKARKNLLEHLDTLTFHFPDIKKNKCLKDYLKALKLISDGATCNNQCARDLRNQIKALKSVIKNY